MITVWEVIAYMCLFCAGADFAYWFHKGFAKKHGISALVNLALFVALIVFSKT